MEEIDEVLAQLLFLTVYALGLFEEDWADPTQETKNKKKYAEESSKSFLAEKRELVNVTVETTFWNTHFGNYIIFKLTKCL